MAAPRDIKGLAVHEIGSLRPSKDVPAGWEMLDAAGQPVEPVAAYLHHLVADGTEPGTRRTYAMALQRWWRFLAAIDVAWQRATLTDFVDFLTWMECAAPRHGGRTRKKNEGYARTTITLTTTILTDFYDHHQSMGTGPMVNPTVEPGIHPSPGQYPTLPTRGRRRKLGRRKAVQRAPRAVPDAVYDDLFVQLGCHRDRALMSLYLSTGARASELLTMTGECIDEGENRVRVRRKGGAEQWLPASPDAMVWLRLYVGDRVLVRGEPVFLTRRRPYRQLLYPACRQVFIRAQDTLGTHYTLHQLRHAAAYRMLQDPNMTITDVQWVLGHMNVGTTQIYTEANPEEVLEKMARHFLRPKAQPSATPLMTGYNQESLRILFGNDQ